MSVYEIGNLAGRLLVSYMIVLFVLLLFSRLQGRQALMRSVRWYGWLITAVVFLLGLSQPMMRGGGLG
ncbi:hypothetical protein [Granulosicoccus antarcticus]|uniref:Uncharacterized protein n=1 Tax=Granulosicoccus antarcticus IMCC3135 TaxID=1192854 RepID=A0A2Z2NKW5_9GAMM|nr:hypothetical protein [Granulosicoccus antarcticus]ASJ71956.1 hypothetical protein IMCC3135_09295 [Granulosicoccus antarcticus IMCC3135]